MNEIEDWKQRINKIYKSLPDKYKIYKWKTCFKSIALDYVLLVDIIDGDKFACDIEKFLSKLEKKDDEKVDNLLNTLVNSLDAYYLSRRDTGRWEKINFGFLEDEPFPKIFVLSYKRWDRNYTLEMLEKWNDSEVFKNTTVFIQKDQKELYKKHHPKFNYYTKDVETVGERFQAVLDFCIAKNIKRAIIMEDEIVNFYHLKKGGVDDKNKLCPNEENLGSVYMKYFASLGNKLMKEDKDLVLLGTRNRVMAQNESTSIIGHHDFMRGGCPNLVYYVDVERLYPIYKQIPKEHYTPQYDWAIQCSIVSNNKHWVMVTGIAKDEHIGNSVIGYDGNREKIAEEMISYYHVEDFMTYRRFSNTKLQGVKIFYNNRSKNKQDELF